MHTRIRSLRTPLHAVLCSCIVAVAWPDAALAQTYLRTIQVNSNSALSAALSSALPGDEIVLANGNYAGFTISRSGTAANPIKVRAANRNLAVITSGHVRFGNNISYAVVEGLMITTSGTSQTIDGRSNTKLAVWFDSAKNCRLTRCKLQLAGHTGEMEWVFLSGNSNFNRIDHCEFGPNSVDSHLIWPRGNPTISGVTYDPLIDRGPWAEGNGPYNPNMARNTLIDHNYFHDHLPEVNNGGESIVLGGMGMTGDYQDTFTIVENNLWENCYGDAELISVKTSSSTIRYNTVRRSGGGFVSRAGNRTHIHGNFILQEKRAGSSGVRIHEMDHLVYNNYFEGTSGEAVHVGDGDPYDQEGFSHAQVKRAKIFHNTFVDCGALDLNDAHPLDPVDLVIANNVLSGTSFSGSQPLAGWVYSKNIIWTSNPNRTGFQSVNPQLTVVDGLRRPAANSPLINQANAAYYPWLSEDGDGHARSQPDIGADEVSSLPSVRRPLTAADVGPDAPEGIVVTEWEAEMLTRNSTGAVAARVADDAANSAAWVSLGSTAAGQFVEFMLPNVPSGLYEVKLRYKAAPDHGILGLGLNGVALGSPLDQYAADAAFRVQSFGHVMLAASGSQTLRLTASGKNGASGGFVLSVDRIVLVPAAGVAAPSFNPGGGSYGDPQQVTITTATEGAAIRYTTDGSAPSQSQGTLYAGPVTIGGSVTLKAIAFKSGEADSAITSEAYSIGKFFFEAEALSYTPSGATAALQSDVNNSGGAWIALQATGAGQFIEYTLPGIPAGTYRLKMKYKQHVNRGILALAVNGATLGSPLDQYSATTEYPEVSFGTVTLPSGGNQIVRLTCTGKNPASAVYTLSADTFTLERISPAISVIADQSLGVNTDSNPLAFTVSDLDTPLESLSLAGLSSNTTLLPLSGIVFSGSGASHTVTIMPAANRTGTVAVTVTVGDGQFTASRTFTVSVTATSSQAWRIQHFGGADAAGNAANTADPDNDGIANLLEFALDGDPNAADVGILPVSALESGDLTLTYTRRKDALGEVNFVVEASTEPGEQWTANGVTQEIVSDDGTRQTVKARVAVNGAGQKFLRLQIDHP